MDWQPTSGAAVGALEARIQSILVMSAQTSWPMLAHRSVSNYVVSAASNGGLQDALAQMLRQHTYEMIYYAAAPDGNGISPTYHSYRPAAKSKGGGVKAIGYWYGCMLTMLKASAEETAVGPKGKLEKKAAQAAAALSHFCADLSNPVHTASVKSVHSAYETWLKNIYLQRDSDPQYHELHEALQSQTKDQVTQHRQLLADVPAAAQTELVAAANADLARLNELWAARKASHQTFSPADAELIALTAKRFAAGASFTADVWYTAFAKKGEPLPSFDQRLYELCPDYDSCLARLETQVDAMSEHG